MDPLEKALKGLEARTLEALLTRLAELQALRAKGEPVRLPQVTLHLRSGRDVQGFVLEQREDRNDKVLVLQALSADARRPEPDALFVRPEAIEALTVHDLPSLQQPQRGGPPPPTKLELRRKLAERQATLAAALGTPLEVQVDWDRLPPEPEAALGALDTLATRAFGILEELSREVLALESLRANVRQVHLAVGSASQVLREGQRLLLVTSLFPTAWMSREALKDALEKVL